MKRRKYCKIWHQCDWEFHAALIAACGSQLHRLYHKRIFDQFRQYVTVDLKTNGFRGVDVITEHRTILDFALKRDVEGCARALQSHLEFYNKHRHLVTN